MDLAAPQWPPAVLQAEVRQLGGVTCDSLASELRLLALAIVVERLKARFRSSEKLLREVMTTILNCLIWLISSQRRRRDLRPNGTVVGLPLNLVLFPLGIRKTLSILGLVRIRQYGEFPTPCAGSQNFL